MGFFKRLRKKKEAAELEIPPAPPTIEELPSPKEIEAIKAVKEAVEKPKKIPTIEEFEEKVAEKEREELEEKERLKFKKPLFIPIESYKELFEEIGLAKGIVKENDDIMMRMGEFKEDQDKEYNKWESLLKDIEKKLIFIDKTLFG